MSTTSIESRDFVTIIRLSDQVLSNFQQMEAVQQELTSALEQAHYNHVLVDLQPASFLTSSMIGQLIQLIQHFKSANVGVKFCRPNEAIRDVMRIIWFERIADVFDTEEEALEAFRNERIEGEVDFMSAAAKREVVDLQPRVEAGDADAQYRLGWCLENGYGVPHNSHDAFRMYGLAALQSHPKALFALATFHAYAITVPQNYEEATRLYQQAAELGLAEAQYVTGMNYDFGIGMPENREAALAWYRKAAAQGHERAQAILDEATTT